VHGTVAVIGGKMASLATKLAGGITKADPADVAIPSVHNDPAYVAATELLKTFRDHLALLERQRLRLIIERELRDKPVGSSRIIDTQLRAQLAALQADPPFTPATPGRTALPNAQSPAIAAALAIVDGAPMPPELDHGDQLAEIDRRQDAIQAAIFEATTERDRIAAELSFTFSTQLRHAWDSLHLEVYRSSQANARASARLQAFARRMTEAGIQPRSDIIKMCPVRAPLMHGSESDWNSEISQHRRQLEEWKLL
jgi:hypothetical protein